MRKILAKLKHAWFLALLFLPQWAFAADNNILPVIPSPTSGFSPTPGDWSVTFLRQIFGQVGNGSVLSGAPQTIIGKLFGVFNSAMLVLISVVVIYIIIKTIMDIASFGEIIGRKISHWTAVRTAFGIGLLVPTASGYSYIQIIIMWAVMQGIGLADTAWTTAVNYLKQGGIIYTSPQETARTDILKLQLVDPVANGSSPETDKIGSSDVLSSLVCMHVIEHAINDKNTADKQYYIEHPENAPKDSVAYRDLMNNLDNKATLQPGYDITKHQVFFPYIKSDDPNSQFNGVCGVYNWTADPFTYQAPAQKCYDKKGKPVPSGTAHAICNADNIVTDDDVKQVTKNYLDAKESGIKQMILTLEPLAQSIVEQNYSNVNNNINSVDNYNLTDSYIINGANDYQTIIYPVVLYAASLEKKGSSTMDKDMINDGWAAAGRYYAQLSENVVLPGLDSNYNQANYQISVDDEKNQYPLSSLSLRQKRHDALGKVEQLLDSYSNTIIDKEVLDKSISQVDRLRDSAFKAAAQRNDDINKSDSETTIPDLGKKYSKFFANQKNFKIHAFDLSSKILQLRVKSAVKTWYDYMVPGYDNNKYNTPPIYKLQHIGDQMMKSAKNTWVDIFVANLALRAKTALAFGGLAIASTGAAFGSTSLLGFLSGGFAALGGAITTLATLSQGILNAVLFMSLPMVISVTTPMFLTGIILSTYVPLIPFMLFTFGIISWIIFVIEAMAAAPLVALGITHPEGHDLMGKAEQALMLWLSVFLRPIAMIIGLIGGMVLIHIAVTVLNAGFGGIVDNLFLNDADKVSSFKSIIVMLIYTFIVVALVNQCFGLIHVIPEKIMRWIGLSPEHSEAPQLMESVKGGITPYAEATGGGAGRTSVEGPQGVGTAGSQAQKGAGKIAGHFADKKAEKQGTVTLKNE